MCNNDIICYNNNKSDQVNILGLRQTDLFQPVLKSYKLWSRTMHFSLCWLKLGSECLTNLTPLHVHKKLPCNQEIVQLFAIKKTFAVWNCPTISATDLYILSLSICVTENMPELMKFQQKSLNFNPEVCPQTQVIVLLFFPTIKTQRPA